MILDKSKKDKIDQFLNYFNEENYSKKVLKNVQHYNDLILIRSL